MKRFAVILSAALSLLAYTVQAQNQLPESVRHIEQFKDDPIALVDAARRFQDQQLELIRWDVGEMQKHKADKDRGLAEAKEEAIQGRIDSNKAVWEYVLGIYPNDPRALNYFAEYWFDVAGDQMAAITFWKRSSLLDDRYGLADNNLGIFYFHIGNYMRGHEYLEKALDIDPNNPDYLFNMAQMYLNHFPQLSNILERSEKKLYKDAMQFSKKAMQNQPDDFELAQDYAVNFFAAENLGVEADWKEAAKAWAHARTLTTEKDEQFYSLLNEARCWMRNGDNDKAVPLLEQAVEAMPDSEPAQNLLNEARGGAAAE